MKVRSPCANAADATAAAPFAWVPNLEALLLDRREEKLVYIEVLLGGRGNDVGDGEEDKKKESSCPIRYVDLTQSSYQKQPADEEATADEDRTRSSAWRDTDIQPGVYEGGRKVWECSWDLLHFLHKQPLEGIQRAWEMGCGHGLPGCYVLQRCPQAHVSFTDYNEDVVLDATLSNIVLNTQVDDDAPEEVRTSSFARVQVGFGDWLDMPVSPSTRFDLILAVETMYTTKAAIDTCELLDRHLVSPTGVAFVATKRYYFGVGGGVDAFRDACAGKLEIETVQVLDCGVGNIREILRVSKPT